MDIDLEIPPPCYSESSASSSSLPRAYLPREFSVGKFKTQPVVTVEDLQAHLRVLGAFSKLKEDVHHMNGASQKEKDQAWVVYVSRAVHRFNTFIGAEWEGGFPGWTEENTPPLDVLMVLHSYLLNPFAYYEDSIRRTTFFSRNLTNLGCFPLHLIASLIDPETLDAYPPSTEREDYFAKTVNDPFTCPLITSASDILSLPCPCCDKMAPKIPWITKDQKGFAQPFFAFTCRSCGKEFTKSMMGIRRFANEVTKKRARRKVHLSETLLDPKTGQPDPTMASMITVSLLRRLNSKFSLYAPCKEEEIDSAARQLAAGLKWSTEVLVEYLQSGLEPKIEFNRLRILPRVARIAAAYTTTGPASIDLVGTVLRQSFFISKMSDMGWSKPGKIPPNQEAANLARAVVRYHAFLDLQSQSTYKLLVPTLDIDLAWHTHQLTGLDYRKKTFKLLGRIPNHDDGIDQVTLQTAYDETAKAWKAQFGVPYSVCGCMMDPFAETSMRTKSGLKKAFTSRSPKKKTVGHLDLLSLDPKDADSSHPSDHNIHRRCATPSQLVRIARQMASKERAAKALEGDGQKDLEEAHRLQAERRQARSDHPEAFTEEGDGQYHMYWGVSAIVPSGFWADWNCDNVVRGHRVMDAVGPADGSETNWLDTLVLLSGA